MNLSKSTTVLAFVLVATASACGSQKESSELQITPRNNFVLSLTSPLISDKVFVQTAEVDLAVNAMGKISWAVTADLQLADFFPKTEMPFSGSYQATHKDVAFATYKNLPNAGQHAVKQHARFVKIMETLDGNIVLQFDHFATGLTGQATIEEGRNGLVEVVNVTVGTTRPVAVKVAEEGAKEGWYEDIDGIWQYGLRKMIGIIPSGQVSFSRVD